MSNDSYLAEADYKFIFEEIINMSDDGFLLVGHDGKVVNINKAYADYLGMDRKDIIGRPITEIIKNTGMINIMEYDRRDTNLLGVINLFEITPELNERLVYITRSPVKNAAKRIIASVAQVKFRKQILSLAKSMNEYNKLLSIYNTSAVTSSASQKQLDEEKDHVRKLFLQIMYYKEELEKVRDRIPDSVIGTSSRFKEAKMAALKAAKNNFSVLLTGETGTGKEVMANLIHCTSDRADKPFIVVNCAAIPSELFEAELFGYEGGAFTGAMKGGKKGKFERADRGTLFLDEIGELPLVMQTKLLRVLQDNILEPLGSSKQRSVDVRIISATNANLEEMVLNKKFRQDLYYRLNELKIHIPKLSERTGDIIPLAQYCLDNINLRFETKVSFSEDVKKYLMNYNWPGNIRQLNNVIKNIYSNTEGDEIGISHLPDEIVLNYQSRLLEKGNLNEYLDSCERNYIIRSLQKNKCNYTNTAKDLGIHRSNLYEKIKKYHIGKSEGYCQDFCVKYS